MEFLFLTFALVIGVLLFGSINMFIKATNHYHKSMDNIRQEREREFKKRVEEFNKRYPNKFKAKL